MSASRPKMLDFKELIAPHIDEEEHEMFKLAAKIGEEELDLLGDPDLPNGRRSGSPPPRLGACVGASAVTVVSSLAVRGDRPVRERPP